MAGSLIENSNVSEPLELNRTPGGFLPTVAQRGRQDISIEGGHCAPENSLHISKKMRNDFKLH
jgi:hypothetical protein